MKAVSKRAANTDGVSWQQIVARYQGPDLRMSIWQLVTSFLPYIALWYLMYLSLQYSYLITLALSVLASGFLLRIFIIFHDCTHGSFFKSRRANEWAGRVCGLLAFTPFGEWRHRHNLHHATTGNLDKRGWWDIDVLTVREYLALPRHKQLIYRLYRNPIVLFMIGAPIFFIILQRIPRRGARPKEIRSVLWTDLALAAMVGGLVWLLGWQAFLLIQLPIAVLSSTVGLWMFYVQHQFEQAYWEHDPEWDYVTASLKGSSYYQLPRVLQWFTGNIGFHHIHHLSAKIPNYRLEQAFRENPLFQDVTTITLGTSLAVLKAKAWDEDLKRMLDFRELHARYGRSLSLAPANPPAGSWE
jgi:omega-6 fatty acid desaturase (delta-12 desaturase)